jgi:hypothetical protein
MKGSQVFGFLAAYIGAESNRLPLGVYYLPPGLGRAWQGKGISNLEGASESARAATFASP